MSRLVQVDGALTITDEGKNFLSSIVTDVEGLVYAFQNGVSSLLVAAAMARLSRRGDDLRIVLLDEFSDGGSAAEGLIDRVVTEYGDDSVQQLVPISLVVEGASNLLTKIIEWGRLAAYLEQSTRYIFFDARDQDGQYKYFTPDLPDDLRAMYRTTVDRVFEIYSKVVRGVTAYMRHKIPEPANPNERTAWLGATRAQACDAARPLLPISTKSTVGIVASAQAIEGLIRRLLASELREAQDVGRLILREARKVAAPFLRRVDMPDRGIAWIDYSRDTKDAVAKLARRYLPLDSPRQDTPKLVALSDFWPRNEISLVPEMLFESSTLPLARLRAIVYEWPKDRKIEVFRAYMGNRQNRRHKPGRALELAHYEFETVGDYGTFRDLQRHRIVDAWEWQLLTTDIGFDVPGLISEAGFEKLFREGFEIAERLYKNLLSVSPLVAQYATLLGHKMRYRFGMNAREAFHLLELRTSPQGHPGYRKICQEMHSLLSKVHPLIGEAMIFVNKSGDPELTRLEAERAAETRRRLILE